jgi:hypothetical protein
MAGAPANSEPGVVVVEQGFSGARRRNKDLGRLRGVTRTGRLVEAQGLVEEEEGMVEVVRRRKDLCGSFGRMRSRRSMKRRR